MTETTAERGSAAFGVAGASLQELQESFREHAYPTKEILVAWAVVQAGGALQEFINYAVQLLHITRATITQRLMFKIAQVAPGEHLHRGRTAPSYVDRDLASLRTVTEDADSAQERIQRFVESTLHQYTGDELIDIGADYGATSWRWVTVGTNCEDCDSKDGKIFGLDEPRISHPRCDCEIELIFDAGFSDLAEQEARSEYA